ncbi:MAG: T9SS type A sorting domain-containing protein [Bacteroidetes bacterium]|nr:T9SS type A sorting domain-containing protein [Bacteroidota bacterium]
MKKIYTTSLAIIILLLMGISPRLSAQYFSKLSDYPFVKIDGSQYYENNGKRYYFDTNKSMFKEGDNELEDAYYSAKPYFRKNKVVYQHLKGTFNNGWTDMPIAVPYIKDGDITHKLDTIFEAYHTSGKRLCGFNGTALCINGAYYFQFENFKIKHSELYTSQASKAVFYWDGDGALTFLHGTEYGGTLSSNLYDEIKVGKIFKEKLFFPVGTEFCYYPKNPNGKGMDITDAPHRVIFENNEDNTNLRYLRTLDINDDLITLLFANDNEYMVGTLSTKDSINCSNSGKPYYEYTMKKIATMQPLSEMTDFRITQELNLSDKDVVCLKRPWEQMDTVRILDIKTNTVTNMKIPTTIETKSTAKIIILKVKNEKLYFSVAGYSIPSIYITDFTYNGTESKAFTRTGYDVSTGSSNKILCCEWENNLYFHFKSRNCKSGLFRLDPDTLMPMQGVPSNRYFDKIQFETIGNSTIFANQYEVGFVGALTSTNTKNCPGLTDTLNIEALEGSTFQWYKNDVAIDEETKESLIYTYSEEQDKYYVAVTNNEKLQNSAEFTTYPNLNGKPEFDLGAKATANCAGAKGEVLIPIKSQYDSVRWYVNNTIIDVMQNNYYSEYCNNLLVELNENTIGKYYVKVYGGVCQYSATSDTLTLDTIGAIKINYNDLIDRKGCEDEALTINISATEQGNTDTDPHSFYFNLYFSADKENENYEFLKNNNSSEEMEYIIPEFKEENLGYYFVEAVGKCNNLNSDTLKIDLGYKYEISDKPQAISDCPETSQELKVVATSEGSINYQWYKNDAIIEGATQNIYSIASLNTSDAGNYKVQVKGDCAEEFTPEVAIEVYKETNILTQPVDVTANQGETAKFKVEAEGEGVISYQWMFNDKTIENKIGAELNLTDLSKTDEGNYKVEVNATCGSKTSDVAGLSIQTTSIKNIAYGDLNVYPNPVQNTLNIDTDLKIVSLQLKSIIGNTISSFDNISGKQIDMSSYKTGIYFLTVQTKDGEATFRIIKK